LLQKQQQHTLKMTPQWHDLKEVITLEPLVYIAAVWGPYEGTMRGGSEVLGETQRSML
jgi:hypothetical protein